MSNTIRRVAVTGAAGYIANSLIQRIELDDAIEQVLAIDLRPPSRQYTSKVVFHQGDVTAPMADLLSEHGIEALVHLAFILSPGHNRQAIRRVNVGGTTNVLNACVQAGVQHILHLSSTTVYGAHPDNPPMLTEESPVRPVSGFQYGEDKARTEVALAQFTREHPTLAATVLRSCPVMGPSTDNFIARAFSKPFLLGVRGHDPPMQLIHEEDLADIMRLCLAQRVSGIYNVAGDEPIPWSEMAGMFGRKLIMLPAPIVYGLTGATWTLRLQKDSPACGLDFVRYRWTVSTEKIQRDLGVSFQYSSREALQDYVKSPHANSINPS